MIDTKLLKQHPDKIKWAIEVKGENIDFDQFLILQKETIELKQELQDLQRKKNAFSKKMAQSSPGERASLASEGKSLGEKINLLKPLVDKKEVALQEYHRRLPSIPHEQAPIGRNANDNVEIRKGGEKPQFSFSPLDHVDILEKNNWAEFEKTANVCGSRSYCLKNEMVLLEMALHRYALSKLREKGMTLMSVPSLVREKPLVGTGHFPMGADQVYSISSDNLYLSGTAEVQLNSLHAGEILQEQDLPICYAGFSPCFRREAGSYGKDVRGLMRVHQFQKVEQYVICANDADESEKWHQYLLGISLEIVEGLELPYRIVECCTGDMGTGKVRMYDVECWVPSENSYRETHSCSNLHDWQARRTNLRYRGKDQKVHYCHTLNNTGLATPRILVSFLECHQKRDQSISIPKGLQAYMDGKECLGGENGKK